MADTDTHISKFQDGDSYIYDGNLGSVPDWVDKGWATYSAGPALAVPKGDPYGQPYTTDVARIGDTILANKDHTRFKVVRAEEIGNQPGGDQPSNLPPQTTFATLEDLHAQGLIDPNPEQAAQMAARKISGAPLGTPGDSKTDAPAGDDNGNGVEVSAGRTSRKKASA